MKRALMAVFVCACAHAAPPQRVEFHEPEVITADPALARASVLVQDGISRVQSGARAEGEILLRQALEIYDAQEKQQPVDPSLPAQAEFWLGEAYRGSFRALALDPAQMDEKALADALEEK